MARHLDRLANDNTTEVMIVLKTKTKIVVTNTSGIIGLSIVGGFFVILLLIFILCYDDPSWDSTAFLFVVSFLLCWIGLSGFLLIRIIHEKVIIDEEGISARLFTESKGILRIPFNLIYRSKYETIPFSQIVGMKDGCMITSEQTLQTLVILTKTGRELHLASHLYSTKTMDEITAALRQQINIH